MTDDKPSPRLVRKTLHQPRGDRRRTRRRRAMLTRVASARACRLRSSGWRRLTWSMVTPHMHNQRPGDYQTVNGTLAIKCRQGGNQRVIYNTILNRSLRMGISRVPKA